MAHRSSRIAIWIVAAVQVATADHNSSTNPKRGSAIDSAIERAQTALLSRQRQDGSWAGEIVMASRQTAYYIIASNYTHHFEHPYYDRALSWLINNQSERGTWGHMVPPEPVSVSNTAVAALALEIAGVPRDAPRLVRAREYVANRGGIDTLDPMIEAMYALYGRADWDGPLLSQFDVTALIYSPKAALSERPPWWREAFVPIAALRAMHRSKRLSLAERQGLREAENWLLSHQLSDGAWFTGIPTFFALLALHDLNPNQYKPQIQNGFGFLHSLQLPSGYQRPFLLSAWDTSLSILALGASDYSECDRSFQPSIAWLVAAQSPGGLGLSESAPGGWSYNPSNLIYADCDDTSLAMQALNELRAQSTHLEYRRRGAVDRAKQWILYMQGRDGGWATFMRDDDKANDTSVPSGIEDFSIPDVTGHALSALGALGYRSNDERIQQAIRYLQRSQRDDGSWYGRWGLSYLYGTAAVLVGLHDVGFDLHTAFVQKAERWLIDKQHSDGGWGEKFVLWDQSRGISYTELSPTSTAEQSAWAILGLLYAGGPTAERSVTRGIDYLLATQFSNGEWQGGAYTVLGIDPYTNSLYSVHWPLMALGRYRRSSNHPVPARHDECSAFDVIYQTVPAQSRVAEFIGDPSNLALSLSAESRDQVRLWLENNGALELHNLNFSLIPEGAPASDRRWFLTSLEARSKVSWRLNNIPVHAGSTWNLHLSYLDGSGHPLQLTRSLSVQGGAVDSKDIVGLSGVVTGLAVLLLGVVCFHRLVKYRTLLSLGLQNVHRHSFRASLTGIGVVLGTAAIGSTLTLAIAFRSELLKDFAVFGSNRLIAVPYQLELKFGPPSVNFRKQPGTRFSDTDVSSVRALPQVVGASPFIEEDLAVGFGGQVLKLTALFVDPDSFPSVAASRLDAGRFIQRNSRREIVLGHTLAHEAFGRQISVGDKVWLDGNEFNVVGTMSEIGGIPGRVETIVSPDIVLYASLDEAVEFTGRNYYDGIEVRTGIAGVVEDVARQAEDIIRQNHPKTEFSVVSSHRLLKQVEHLLGQFTAITLVISLLTLLTSGVGVSNMMLTSVRERLAEIGIMKAIGAKDQTVLVLFLTEAGYVGLMGALPGAVFGFVILLLLKWISGVSILPVAPLLLMFSVVFSVLVTVVFGTYPAYLAARLQPAEALRRG